MMTRVSGFFMFATYLCLALFCDVTQGVFNAESKNNVVVYYGQGPNQKSLSEYCADTSIDVIVLSFVHLFPQQANGYPGIDFGNQCWAETYPGPGYGGRDRPADNRLLRCPNLQRDLNACRQTRDGGAGGKKILLSLGGGTGAYQLTGAADGEALAGQLWSMFGPRQAGWVARGLPRPFDYNGVGFSVDGFDLDIEHPATDGSAGYRALAAKLRSLYATAPPATKFYLTASPQCVVPDASMKDILLTAPTTKAAVAFDMIFVQFYNTAACSARRWADANPAYVPGSGPSGIAAAGFTYDAWKAFLAGTPSRNARIYIGLPGSAAAARPGFDLTVKQAANIASAHYCRANFGGVAIWDATYAGANVAGGKNFYQNVKAALNAAAVDKRLPCVRGS